MIDPPNRSDIRSWWYVCMLEYIWDAKVQRFTLAWIFSLNEPILCLHKAFYHAKTSIIASENNESHLWFSPVERSCVRSSGSYTRIRRGHPCVRAPSQISRIDVLRTCFPCGQRHAAHYYLGRARGGLWGCSCT